MKVSLAAVCILVLATIETYSQNDSLLIRLNSEVRRKDEYSREKMGRIAVLYNRLEPGISNNTRFEILRDLTNEYKSFIFDSAFSVVMRLQATANALNDPTKKAYAKTQLGFILLSSGMFKETLDSLESLSVKGLPDSIRSDYYFVRARAYYDLGDFDRDAFYGPRYIALGNQYLDSALSLAPANSYLSLYLIGLKNLKNENNEEALVILNKLLTSPDLTQHQLAVTASTLSYFYIFRKQDEEAINLLAQAAIADIQTATKETSAMPVLAELLYNQGDIINAYTFIHEAMDDAVFYGARQRKMQVGSILPVITAAKVNNVEEQRKLWLVYSAIITSLSALVLVFAITTFKQLKKRKIAERALQESNRIKEEYIGYYFNINSEYLSKIEAFKKSVEMKMMTKKPDDIKLILNNINLKKEREELYYSFDKVFLKLFPEFVNTFNSYFKEEDRIVLKDGQLLNTELRIFALIRMGIHDTEKIARILDYSINTIYNYKARVKGKSIIPNEDFEKKIMEIHAI